MQQQNGKAVPGVGEELLQTPDAAAALHVSPFWLHRARSEGRGPRFIRIGRKVFYRRSDLRAYVDACAVETEDTREVG